MRNLLLLSHSTLHSFNSIKLMSPRSSQRSCNCLSKDQINFRRTFAWDVFIKQPPPPPQSFTQSDSHHYSMQIISNWINSAHRTIGLSRHKDITQTRARNTKHLISLPYRVLIIAWTKVYHKSTGVTGTMTMNKWRVNIPSSSTSTSRHISCGILIPNSNRLSLPIGANLILCETIMACATHAHKPKLY